MTKLEIQRKLTDELDNASRLYYNGEQSPLTDTEFDLKLKQLQELEKETGQVFPNSPTNRVGSDIQDGFKKGEHPRPMLTIENVYDDEGLKAWLKYNNDKYGTFIYNISVKYDGISCELHYKDGLLVKALTRGDKLIGDDITENVKTIKNVPLSLPSPPTMGMFYVRGEILMPKSSLAKLNEERIANGEAPLANTRNACSGSIKQLDPKVTASRGLTFRAWDCFMDGFEPTSMEWKTYTLQHNGFYYEANTTPYGSVLTSIDAFVEEVNLFKKMIDSLNLDYDYDGVVIKINNVRLQNQIGTTDTRAVAWAIARKWNEDFVTKTTLESVDWQVGRTGVVTPVGRLTPVECGGVVISNVTLNNVNFILEHNLHDGDELKITRSGGVIPYVLDAQRTDKSIHPAFIPTKCPECGEPLIMDGALLKCTNDSCPAIVKGKILQFCSKDCMDIRTIGESVVSDLVDKHLISDVAGLYFLNRYTVTELVNALGEGYGEKKVKKMLEEIEKSKEKSWDRVLAGLSIPGVGKVVARTLSKYSRTQLAYSVGEEELAQMDGIGEIMAADIHSWFENYINRNILAALEYRGVKTQSETKEEVVEGGKLEGMTVCFTGSSYRFKGDEVEAFLEKNGAKCVHSVSKKLTYLITGDKPGSSKVNKAAELGVETIGEEEFYNKYNLNEDYGD